MQEDFHLCKFKCNNDSLIESVNFSQLAKRLTIHIPIHITIYINGKLKGKFEFSLHKYNKEVMRLQESLIKNMQFLAWGKSSFPLNLLNKYKTIIPVA